MARVASTLLVLGLLVATAAAFAITERLKLQPSPISGTEVGDFVSPATRDPVEIKFRVRRPDSVTLAIIDEDGNVVREIAADDRLQPGARTTYRWDGRDDAGAPVPEDVYKPRVRLREARKTIVLPNEIRVDATRPVVTLAGVVPVVFSPDGDGRRDFVSAYYTLDEPAKAYVYVDGRRAVEGRGHKLRGRLEWYGRTGRRRVTAGAHRLSVVAIDLAGNRGESAARVVTLRYVSLSRESVRVRAGARFAMGVSSDAAGYDWRLAGRTGRGFGTRLVLRAPDKPGRYTLFVRVRGRADTARVTVVPRER